MRGAQSADVESFECKYRASSDPWGYASSTYELDKYKLTIAAIATDRVPSALEMGCSIGVFTAMLAERCDVLRAVDFSSEAIRLARSRTRSLPGVQVERRDLRLGLPEGSFDLVVCSEVLYYWELEEVAECLQRVEDSLNPGGSLIVVNWRGADPEAPLDAESVRYLLRGRSALRSTLSESYPGFLLDRLELRT